MGESADELVGGVYTFSTFDVIVYAAAVYVLSTLVRRFRRAAQEPAPPKKTR